MRNYRPPPFTPQQTAQKTIADFWWFRLPNERMSNNECIATALSIRAYKVNT